MGRFVFIPSNDYLTSTGNGLRGNIHYKFNDTKYETIFTKPLEDKIRRLCVLIVYKGRYAVGLEYISNKQIAPVVVIISDNVKEVVLLCKKNDVKIAYDKKLTEALYKDGEIEEPIPIKLWEITAKLLGRLMKRDENFLRQKINNP